MDFIDLKPIALGNTPLGSRAQTPKLHDWELDWQRLAELIRDNGDVMSEVKAGLAEDWINTHGTVWDDQQGYYQQPNNPSDPDGAVFWGSSTWATPAIVVTFHNELEKSFALYKTGNQPQYQYLGSLNSLPKM